MKDGLTITKFVHRYKDYISVYYRLDFYKNEKAQKKIYVSALSTFDPDVIKEIADREIKENDDKYEYISKKEFLDARWFLELEEKGLKAFYPEKWEREEYLEESQEGNILAGI